MYTKYPKTMHLPNSPGLQNDDRRIESLRALKGEQVVVTEKVDGEGTSLYHDHIHARSLDSGYHPSREWIKGFWGSIKHEIPKEMRICGESMYAMHSIYYADLLSYFYGFSVWEGNRCLSWNDTLEWFSLLGITPVPVWYMGVFDQKILDDLWSIKDPNHVEGYVVRVTDSFSRDQFPLKVAKFVRKGHVQTDELWMNKPVIPNKLKQI